MVSFTTVTSIALTKEATTYAVWLLKALYVVLVWGNLPVSMFKNIVCILMFSKHSHLGVLELLVLSHDFHQQIVVVKL